MSAPAGPTGASSPAARPPARPSRTRLVWFATVAVALGVAVSLAALHSSPAPAPLPAPARPDAADRDAPRALIAAADAVGFHPTSEPGVGVIESEPASAAQPPSNPHLLAVGTTAPAFALRTPQGERVSLSQYRGKAVLLEFFATWCPHCNAEAPHLRALDASLPQTRYAFVSVDADGETAPSVFAFHRYYGLEYPALIDPSSQPGSFNSEGSPGAVSSAYRVAFFPTFYVVDPHGTIVWRSDGEQPDALLRNELAIAANAT